MATRMMGCTCVRVICAVAAALLALPAKAHDSAAPATLETLDRMRGGDNREHHTTTMALGATMAENRTYSMATGVNLVTNGSLHGASGVATVIQNSGNNVIIQNAFILNLKLQ